MFTKKMAFTYFITVILIFNTGWIDSVVLYNSFGASVAVMSGNLRILGHSIAGSDWFFVYKVTILVFGFVVGAAVNGVLMKTDAYVISEDHTKTLVLQSAVMLTGTLLIDIFSNHRIIDDLFLAVAMGMQNSFTTIFFGGFARTTHMTGTTTDLGIEIGRVLRGDSSNIWKIPFFATCMITFVVGNAVGFAWVRIAGEYFTLMLFPSVILPIFVGIVILIAYNMKIKNHSL
ncbi:YoaK family protein [Francisella sp. SYW-9]|uniref:YoaK family protein n=1 Tax=Francisella sp. SYW-9 TaxID=2610888 RepID=UPI00123DFBC1|nr:YoaK family protein [Francisella sp. SYW-9]